MIQVRGRQTGKARRMGVQTWELHTTIKDEPVVVQLEIDFLSAGMRRLINRAAASNRKLATEASGALKVRIITHG